MSDQKRCSKCGETKPATDFYPASQVPKRDGTLRRLSWCKACSQAASRTQYLRFKEK